MKEPITHSEFFPGHTSEQIFDTGIVMANIPPIKGVVFESNTEVLSPDTSVKLGVSCLPKHIDAHVSEFSRGELLGIHGESRFLGKASLAFSLLEYEDEEAGASTQVDFSLLIIPSRFSKAFESEVDKHLTKAVPEFGPEYKVSIITAIQQATTAKRPLALAA